MTTRRKSRRTRGFGSAQAAHQSRWQEAHASALEEARRADLVLERGHCGRAAEILGNMFYSHGRASAEAWAMGSDGPGPSTAQEGLRADRVFAVERQFQARCVRKPGLVERAKRALRRKP